MGHNEESKASLEYIDGNGKQSLHEGDYIICRNEDGSRHIGRIVLICGYQETEGAEPESAICIDTSKSGARYSREVIKVADIRHICRNTADDLPAYPETDEALDRDSFIRMLVGLGHDREKAETKYHCMRGIMALYNVPLSSLLYNAIQGVELNADGRCQDELIEISNKLMGTLAQVFEAITRSIRRSVDNPIISQDRNSSF